MSLGTNLATRITALLLAGFVLLQLVILATMTLPGRGNGVRPYNLPPPEQLSAMVSAVERTPADRRPAMLALLNGSLFTIRLLPGHALGERDGTAQDLRILQIRYAAAVPGRAVAVEGWPGPIGQLIRERPGPLHYFSPVQVSVALDDGNMLVIDSRPSTLVRDYLRQRALLGLLGGLAVLSALVFAVRQTTRPLIRMSAGVRRFATALVAPDLPIEGSREVRELSTAFNDMKARIGGLIGERTHILAGIAHDMRTYLTRLRLRAEFIDDVEQRTKAATDLDEMALLLDDTLLFARTEGGARGRPIRVDVADELAVIVAQRVEMGEAVTLETSTKGAIIVDRVALRRMLANLIDNGLRYGNAVTVSLIEGDEIEISVADDGPGVPTDALAGLGQPYARLDPSRDRASGGAGLGLAIVRALAQQAGASLMVANHEPHGLRATIRFPRTP